MAAGGYSFIDISVLDEIRAHFAAGAPLVLLTPDLMTVIWANGPGAGFLGYDDVETAMGAPAELDVVARRQIAAVPGYPAIGRDVGVGLRLSAGFSSRSLQCRASAVRLPDGSAGILLILPDGGVADGGARDVAARAIGGIGSDGRYAALIDGECRVLAETEGFSALGIDRRAIARLIDAVRDERDRLVKQMIGVADGRIAAGIGRLTDEPPMHLLVMVAATPAETAEAEPAPGPAMPEPAIPEPAAPGPSASARTGSGEIRSDATGREPEAPPAETAPLRFSWRTDADGRIVSISQSFSETFGRRAAAMTGMTFAEVAATFGIDRDGAIGRLLERRDTWSGRTVHWPVEGTDRMVPVDLAALPTYGRDRGFEGFRGFGVARMGEIAADPEARGLKLAGRKEEAAAPIPPVLPTSAPGGAEIPIRPPTPAVAGPADDPFRGEKPAIRTDRLTERRQDDKVIRLSAHRGGALRALSDSERSAFQEIAQRLRRETGARPDGAGETGTMAEMPAPAEVVPASPQHHDEPRPSISVEIARSGFLPSAFAAGGADTFRGMQVLERLPVAVLIRSGDRLDYANGEFFRLTGYASLDELSRAGGFERLFSREGGLGDEAGAARHAIGLLTRDGIERPCEALLRSVDWDGRRALMLAIRPVEDNEKEIRLKERVEELTAILDTATDGVVLIDSAGVIRSINRSAEALFGFESDELAGKPFTALFAVESQRSASDYLAGLTEHGVASVLNDGREVIGREAKGRFIPLFMTIGRLPGKGGFCAVLRDITPWKRAEEELIQARGIAERASSQKTGFLARISHEIRTPLNAIIGFSELMMDERFGPIGNERYRDYLRDINRSGNHVLDLVNDLLDISKIEAGEQELSFEAVSLNDSLADAVAMMQPEANRERVIIRSSFASRLPEVVADRRSIKQIALNLLSNAIRFTPAGGQVIVSTAIEPSGDVVLRVRDTGIGMTKPEIEQALRPFKQISRLNHRRTGGTGLGLPLTKAMVEANRARFAIDSVPDEGTIVEITFPSTRVLAD